MPHKVLLIDDSTTQLEMLKLQFIDAGFEVETAKNGGEGYQKVFESTPDLILSDIIMPNLNGYQLCRLLKNNAITKDIPVILLTVLDKKIDKFWGNKSGADKFISKTANFEEIKEASNELINLYPVSNEYKQTLISKEISEETVQNQINNILDELLMDSTFLNEFRDLGEFVSNEKLLIKKTFELLSSFVDYNVAGLFLNSQDKNEKKILYLDINKEPVSGFVIEKIKRDFFALMPNAKEFSIRDFGHEIVGEKTDDSSIISNPMELKGVHIVPLVFNGISLGGFCFYNKEDCDYKAFKFYKTLLSELSLLLKTRYLYAETEYLSVTDGLTKLYNRRHFEYHIEREFLRTKRYSSALSLALVDIDFFKRVNDTYGHQFGDYVLSEISKLVSDSFRKTDMVCRYGGEEIAVVLTETSLENAMIPLERLREKISQHEFIYNEQKAEMTVSIGVAANHQNMKSQKDLIECADKALYQAKQNGRNQVIKYNYEEFNSVI